MAISELGHRGRSHDRRNSSPLDRIGVIDASADTSPQESQVRPSIAPNCHWASSLASEPLVLPLVTQGASQCHSDVFDSLKHQLFCKSRQESLYDLTGELAGGVIDGLEQGSREDSGLCAADRETFSRVLRKMCCKHKLLPSSYAITNELERTEESPCKGGSADVFRGWYRGSKVAIKQIRPGLNRDSVERRFCHEVVLWKQFKHPNLLPLLGATSHTLTMVSEWMEHGTIMDFVTAFPETNRLKLLEDVVRGLKYLHDWPSVHADLKGNNILIDSDFSARITDFGLTSVLHEHSRSMTVTPPTCAGTLRWMAPEFFRKGPRPSKASDVYALGMVAYQVFAHEVPFAQVNSNVVPGWVFDGKRPSRPPNREILGLSDEVWLLMENCWDGDPTARPDIANILSFFKMASSRWVPPTSEAIVNLGLDRSVTVRTPPTVGSTCTHQETWQVPYFPSFCYSAYERE